MTTAVPTYCMMTCHLSEYDLSRPMALQKAPIFFNPISLTIKQ